MQSDKNQIFTYNGRSLNTHLKSNGWTLTNVQISDTLEYQKLFADPRVVTKYGYGTLLNYADIPNRIKGILSMRHRHGQPAGCMTIRDEKDQFLGYTAVVLGKGAGVGSLSFAFSSEAEAKNVHKEVISSIVNEWAPEVKRIGNNPSNENYDNFRHFGLAPLSKITASTILSNKDMTNILINEGFKPAEVSKDNSIEINFKDRGFASGIEEMKAVIEEYFDNNKAHSNPLAYNNRNHSYIDPQGNKHTISRLEKGRDVEYQLERQI